MLQALESVIVAKTVRVGLVGHRSVLLSIIEDKRILRLRLVGPLCVVVLGADTPNHFWLHYLEIVFNTCSRLACVAFSLRPD